MEINDHYDCLRLSKVDINSIEYLRDVDQHVYSHELTRSYDSPCYNTDEQHVCDHECINTCEKDCDIGDCVTDTYWVEYSINTDDKKVYYVNGTLVRGKYPNELDSDLNGNFQLIITVDSNDTVVPSWLNNIAEEQLYHRLKETI